MIGLLFKIIFLPFTLLWWLVGIVFILAGKLVTAGIGLIVLLIGLALCITLIGLPLGVIFTIFGALLMIKGIF